MEWLAPLLGLALLTAGGLLIWRWRRRTHEVDAQHAREQFPLHRPNLEAEFLRTAGATGKPRGLRWKALDWDPATVFARDRQSGLLTALLGVTVHFEAIPGSDMEGHDAVGLPRNATALFYFRHGRWETAGRTVFNLNPGEVLARYPRQFERFE